MPVDARKKEVPTVVRRRREARRSVYLGEGFHASVSLGDKPVRANVVDMSPSGLGLLIVRPAFGEPPSLGESVRIDFKDRCGHDFSAQGTVCNVRDMALRKQAFIRIGVQFDEPAPGSQVPIGVPADAAARGPTGATRSDMFPCDENMLPAGFFDDPFFFQERIHFSVVAFSPTGLAFRTAFENKSLLPQIVVRAKMFFPKLGLQECDLRMVHVEIDNTNDCYLVRAEFLRPEPAFLETVAEYLSLASVRASPKTLAQAGFRKPRLLRALQFKSATTAEELRSILKLRQLDAVSRKEEGAEAREAESFVDAFDEHARKVLCRVGRRIVAGCRLVFVGAGEIRRSEFFARRSEIPKSLGTEGFVEVSRLNWHPHYSSPDLFFYMMQNLVRIAMEAGERYLVVSILPASWPIYRKLGFRPVENNTQGAGSGQAPALVLRLDVPRALRGLEEIDQATFKSVYLPVARHLGIANFT